MLMLINAEKKCRAQGQGKILLANVPERVLSSLKLAGFDQIFEIFPDVTAAIGQF
jgi:anti-anti-sigma regulatory factor